MDNYTNIKLTNSKKIISYLVNEINKSEKPGYKFNGDFKKIWYWATLDFEDKNVVILARILSSKLISNTKTNIYNYKDLKNEYLKILKVKNDLNDKKKKFFEKYPEEAN